MLLYFTILGFANVAMRWPAQFLDIIKAAIIEAPERCRPRSLGVEEDP
jgi:hypothetical protein